ncbi:hypothetical protein D3C73_686760 [compost metagenome]
MGPDADRFCRGHSVVLRGWFRAAGTADFFDFLSIQASGRIYWAAHAGCIIGHPWFYPSTSITSCAGRTFSCRYGADPDIWSSDCHSRYHIRWPYFWPLAAEYAPESRINLSAGKNSRSTGVQAAYGWYQFVRCLVTRPIDYLIYPYTLYIPYR